LEIGPEGSHPHHPQDLGEVDGNFHTEGHYGSRLFSTVQLSEMGTKIKRNHGCYIVALSSNICRAI